MNQEQEKIIKSNDKYIYIDAGAGTGKTYTLIKKIEYILANNLAKAQEILAITFTNKAAIELKARLGNEDVIVKTFHKYIYDLINNDNKYTLCDENIFSPNELLKISKYKNGQSLFKPLGYYQYQNYLKKHNQIDFDDIFLVYLQNNYKNEKIMYLLIDEFQDTNNLQYKIIKRIISSNTRIICVGDINQSIYSFRGANNKIIKRYIKEFNAKVYNLTYNYRSSKTIISFINYFNNKNKLVTNNDKNSIIKTQRFNNIHDENEFIYNIIKTLNKKIALTNILITARNEKRLFYIKEYLSEKILNYYDLNIMTLHSTKGLEFHSVIITGLEKNEFPQIVDNSLKEYYDEKRLFYVGISRAKENLFLISNKLVHNKIYYPSIFYKLSKIHNV